MSTCEKCWEDAYSPYGDQATRYAAIVKTQTCTPEQQAGRNAIKCPKCGRWSIHQHTLEPMCGCVLASTSQSDTEQS